ncbi:MAG: DUF4263 domain-containing protein [Candidatus Nanoarchaeia archaeon]|nr:DUF4263 domain-containing protein [Candidatus Portnoybacteria bacterium]MDD4983001.1 DUF4263 domain-containing protein [Candidatus Portnoybacteria bacterium]MDD5499864.1 DUF4263 domain-containing protein [Candidatus Nanoarchaeia archaeon]
MAIDWKSLNPFKPTEADIINNKKAGMVYVADFPNGAGKYISITEYGTPNIDADIKISPRICLRLTYLQNEDGGRISGVEVAKVNGDNIEKINFSTLDFERILQLLHVFSELDLKAVANRSILLEKSIIGDAQATQSFLNLIAADPLGQSKITEIAKNLGLIDVGDIDYVIQRKNVVAQFDQLLNNDDNFEEYKGKLGVKKPEEVWQKFFESNSWILGSDFVEVLSERVIDEENKVDIPVKDYDGFINIIELKLPGAIFWNADIMPTSDLTKAIMQCARYITELERRMNDDKKKDAFGADILKPKITLIYGRSNSWRKEHKTQFKILNSSFHDIAILSYDHVLERAKKIIGESNKEQKHYEAPRP